MTTSDDAERVALAVWAAYYENPAQSIGNSDGRRAAAGSHPGVIWHSLFAQARTLPGFTEFAQRLGMVDYWRAYGFADFCKSVGQRIECR